MNEWKNTNEWIDYNGLNDMDKTIPIISPTTTNRVIGRDVTNLDERGFRLGQFPCSEIRSGQILQDFHVGILEELLEAILVHLNGGDHLLLFDVDVSDVEPDVAEVGRGFAHLSEDVARFGDVTLLSENGANAIGGPDVALIELQHLSGTFV